MAKESGRNLLTHDMDFSNIAVFPPSEYPGIIILRVNPPTLEKSEHSLESLFEKLEPKDFPGKLIILEEKRFWIF